MSESSITLYSCLSDETHFGFRHGGIAEVLLLKSATITHKQARMAGDVALLIELTRRAMLSNLFRCGTTTYIYGCKGTEAGATMRRWPSVAVQAHGESKTWRSSFACNPPTLEREVCRIDCNARGSQSHAVNSKANVEA